MNGLCTGDTGHSVGILTLSSLSRKGTEGERQKIRKRKARKKGGKKTNLGRRQTIRGKWGEKRNRWQEKR